MASPGSTNRSWRTWPGQVLRTSSSGCAQGIELLISLTEDPPPRAWINEAGLFLIHIPVQDLTAPTQEQLDESIAAIRKAHRS